MRRSKNLLKHLNPGIPSRRAITRGFEIRINRAVGSSLLTLGTHVIPQVNALSQYLDHPKNRNDFVNPATRLSLERYKILIQQKSVLLADSCRVDRVDRPGRGALGTVCCTTFTEMLGYFKCP